MIHLNREGHTLVVTTHDVEKVIAHVNRIAIIHDGELKIAGPPEELIAKLPIFGIRPPAMLFSGGKKFHGSNSPSLFSREFSASSLGCPMQIPRTPDDHRNPSPTESHMACLRFHPASWPSHPLEIASQAIFP